MGIKYQDGIKYPKEPKSRYTSRKPACAGYATTHEEQQESEGVKKLVGRLFNHNILPGVRPRPSRSFPKA